MNEHILKITNTLSQLNSAIQNGELTPDQKLQAKWLINEIKLLEINPEIITAIIRRLELNSDDFEN